MTAKLNSLEQNNELSAPWKPIFLRYITWNLAVFFRLIIINKVIE